ncbi:recombinase family protein [Pseudaestuariivita rosea]|uniref:recombinase family protein n=1 Tax=Pseudaestuariivita rosea TaxID=2763263 RepID=UPI001F183925|nr:recombinase family protein [Pseudaestuariivita rosea]
MMRACQYRKSRHTRQVSKKYHEGRKIGYMRVSDLDQSEALQRDALQQAECDLIFCDHGLSGVTQKRPGLSELMVELRSGDTLVVWKLDRLGRSTIHLLKILEELRDRGMYFTALTQGIDTTTAVGRMIYGQLAVFAEYERSLISERTKAGMAAAKARGKILGRPKIITTERARRYASRVESGQITLADLAKDIEVSPRTLHRAICGFLG